MKADPMHVRTPRTRRRSLLLSGLILFAAPTACSGNDSASPHDTSTTLAGAPPTITQPGGKPVPPPTTAAQASTDAHRALDRIGGNLTLNNPQRACVATELDKQPDLLNSLGEMPTDSPRWAEVTKIASNCVTQTSFASTFASNIGRSIPGATPEQVACLRDTLPNYLRTEDISTITQDAMNPTGTTPGADDLKKRLDDWINSCGLPTPPTPGFDIPPNR